MSPHCLRRLSPWGVLLLYRISKHVTSELVIQEAFIVLLSSLTFPLKVLISNYSISKLTLMIIYVDV